MGNKGDVVDVLVVYQLAIRADLGTQVIGPLLIRGVADGLAQLGLVSVRGGLGVVLGPEQHLVRLTEQGCLVGDLQGLLAGQRLGGQRNGEFELFVRTRFTDPRPSCFVQLDDQVPDIVLRQLEHVGRHFTPPVILPRNSGLDGVQIRQVEQVLIDVVDNAALGQVDALAGTDGELVVQDHRLARLCRGLSRAGLVERGVVVKSFLVVLEAFDEVVDVETEVGTVVHDAAVGGLVPGDARLVGPVLAHILDAVNLRLERERALGRVILADVRVEGLADEGVLADIIVVREVLDVAIEFDRFEGNALGRHELRVIALPCAPGGQRVAYDDVLLQGLLGIRAVPRGQVKPEGVIDVQRFKQVALVVEFNVLGGTGAPIGSLLEGATGVRPDIARQLRSLQGEGCVLLFTVKGGNVLQPDIEPATFLFHRVVVGLLQQRFERRAICLGGNRSLVGDLRFRWTVQVNGARELPAVDRRSEFRSRNVLFAVQSVLVPHGLGDGEGPWDKVQAFRQLVLNSQPLAVLLGVDLQGVVDRLVQDIIRENNIALAIDLHERVQVSRDALVGPVLHVGELVALIADDDIPGGFFAVQVPRDGLKTALLNLIDLYLETQHALVGTLGPRILKGDRDLVGIGVIYDDGLNGVIARRHPVEGDWPTEFQFHRGARPNFDTILDAQIQFSALVGNGNAAKFFVGFLDNYLDALGRVRGRDCTDHECPHG